MLARFFRLTVAVAALAACAAPSMAATRDVMIDAMTVRFRDDVASRDATTLPAKRMQALQEVLRNGAVVTARSREGAFELRLAHPLPFADAMAALDRVRMEPDVLHASLGARVTTPVARQIAAGAAERRDRPVVRMIVKFRDTTLSDASLRGEPLPPFALQNVSALAGQPLGRARPMSNGAWLVDLFRRTPLAEAQAIALKMEASSDVEYAEPDAWMYPQLVPNDPNYAVNQWDLQPSATALGGVGMAGAWNITTGHSSIVVGDLDTGILPNHPDLAGRTVAGYDMVAECATANDAQPGPCTWTVPGTLDPTGGDPDNNSRDNDPSDPGDWVTGAEDVGFNMTQAPYNWFVNCTNTSGVTDNSSWHGSHTAGTIGANTNNATGIAGINWVSKLQAVRVLGKCGGYLSDIADGITWASGGTVSGVPANLTPSRVINMSLGGSGACGTTYQTAIDAAIGRGTLIVVSAGNANVAISASNTRPANCAGVVTVASVGKNGNRAYYSNYDDGTAPTYVTIAAPGGEQSFANDPLGTLSTLNAGTTVPAAYNYIYYQGTSMAAPHVTGIASLMMSANRSLTPSQVTAKITSTARAFPTATVRDCTASLGSVTGTVKYCGAGIIDATAAVYSAKTWDLFWRKSDGTNSTWLFNGTGAANLLATFPSGVPINWTTKFVGDVNGDGVLDVVWLDGATGQPAIWLMTSPTTVASASFPPSVGAGSGWTLAGVGDVNGDGRADLVWRNTTTGQALVWVMSVTGTVASTFDLGVVPLTYELRGVGDFNGDGRSDLAWFRASDGGVVLYLMNANGTHSDVFPASVGPGSWRPYRFGDFDGDGKGDIFWRNEADGSTAVWYMNGGTIAASDFFTTVPLAAWTLGSARDLDLDRHDDLTWYSPSTGSSIRWLMQARHVAPVVQNLPGLGAGWTPIP